MAYRHKCPTCGMKYPDCQPQNGLCTKEERCQIQGAHGVGTQVVDIESSEETAGQPGPSEPATQPGLAERTTKLLEQADDLRAQAAQARARATTAGLEKNLEEAKFWLEMAQEHERQAKIRVDEASLEARSAPAASASQQDGMKRKLEEMQSSIADIKDAVLRGRMQYTIFVQTNIPGGLLEIDRSAHASAIGADRSAAALTAFLKDHVIRTIYWNWHPLDGHAAVDEARPIANEDELKAAVEESSFFGYVKVGYNNNFNVEATIQDPAGQQLILKARVDALIVQNQDPQILQNMAKTALIKSTLLFVEIESGEKGMDNATLQLLAAMKAMAAQQGMSRLYGVVVDRLFTQARLVKFERDACVQNGIFHPSQLGRVATIVQQVP
mmetsp:Transcript_17229/g.40078  ORF Transcript_17229/g.40078 Transcript_17229/m.40078 type:complete len:384 (-) Transcript_17229:41-1192(-)